MLLYKKYIFLFSIPLLISCGYTLKHRLKDSFEKTKDATICIPWFINKTEYVGIERIFTNALIRELRGRGELVLLNDSSCPYYLKGEIISISVTPTVFTEPGFKGLQNWRRLPIEYNTTISISLKLIKKNGDHILWQNNFNQSRRINAPPPRTHNYEAPSSVGLMTDSIVEVSFYEVAKDLMRDVYDDIVEFF